MNKKFDSIVLEPTRDVHDTFLPSPFVPLHQQNLDIRTIASNACFREACVGLVHAAVDLWPEIPLSFGTLSARFLLQTIISFLPATSVVFLGRSDQGGVDILRHFSILTTRVELSYGGCSVLAQLASSFSALKKDRLMFRKESQSNLASSKRRFTSSLLSQGQRKSVLDARFLTSEKKQKRLEYCKFLLDRYWEEGDNFLLKIVVGDESWIPHFNLEKRDRVWSITSLFSSPKKIQTVPSARKILLTFFWDLRASNLTEHLNLATLWIQHVTLRHVGSFVVKCVRFSGRQCRFYRIMTMRDRASHMPSAWDSPSPEVRSSSPCTLQSGLAPSDFQLFPYHEGYQRHFKSEEVCSASSHG